MLGRACSMAGIVDLSLRERQPLAEREVYDSGASEVGGRTHTLESGRSAVAGILGRVSGIPSQHDYRNATVR